MKRLLIYLLLNSLLLLVLVGCGSNALPPTPPADEGSTVTPAPTPTPPADEGGTVTPVPTPTPPADEGSAVTPESTIQADGASLGAVAVATLASELDSRTPEPTPTPSLVDRGVERIASEAGLGNFSFLGLTGADWINVGISILMLVIGYWLLNKLLFHVLSRAVQRTKTTFDDELLKPIGPDIEKVVGILLLRYVTLRLGFLGVSFRTFIDDATFVLGLIFIVIICLKLVDFSAEWYKKFVEPHEKKAKSHLDPVIALLQHASDVIIIIMGMLIALVHFGLEISVFTSIVLILGFGVVLGARAIVTDLVSGFIILVGQPFRVGDGIQLQDWPDYGIVEAIGSRATQVRFFDNRTAIIRNADAINNQLLNYSTPDSTMRIQTDIRIAYHADLNQIRKLITDTVQGVDGVQPDKPIEILFQKFGDSTRLIRVRWWISDFAEGPYIIDDVNSAIEAALNKAGFNIPYSTLDLNLNQIEELRQLMSGAKSSTDDQESKS